MENHVSTENNINSHMDKVLIGYVNLANHLI